MRKILKAIDVVDTGLGRILSYLNIAVVTIVCWEIVARYVFNAPTVWASEAMVMLSGAMYALAAGYAQLNKRHVRIDLVYSKLGVKGKAVCDALGYLFFSLFIYALVVHGGIFAWDSIQLAETSGTPWNPIVYPVKAAIPIGASLLWLQVTADLIRGLLEAFGGKEG